MGRCSHSLPVFLDGGVSVQYDVTNATQNVGDVAGEVLARFVNMIDEAYPELMRATWS